MSVYALLLTHYAVPALAQGKEKPPPAVDQAKIDAAIGRGAEWLRARLKEGLPSIHDAENLVHKGSTYNEMVLYTLVHAGVDRGDADLIKLVNEIRGKPPCHTYVTALRAMAFEMYDPVKLRQDLIQCADFLVNNQAKNGMWGYSEPLSYPPLPEVTFTPTAAPPNYTLSGPNPSAGPRQAPPADAGPGGDGGAAPAAGAGGAGGPGGGDAGAERGRPVPTGAKASTTQAKKPPRHPILRRGWGRPNDNSNTQFAMLGLRACMAQGILPPPDCLQLAEKWVAEEQNKDGGWGYHEKRDHEPSYGSMTAGGVSSLAVCVRARGGTPVRDPRVHNGIQWLAAHLRFHENPEKPIWPQYFFYWVYSVERAGSMVDTEWFGDHPWYSEGAAWLLANQHENGTWGQGGAHQHVQDTCFAILFLRRATRHIARQKVYTQ